MIIPNYNCGYQVVSFAKSASALDNLLSDKHESLYYSEDNLFFLPQNIAYTIPENLKQNLNRYNDYDVLEIYPDGHIFRLYNASSEDNGIVLTEKCNSNCIMCPSPASFRKNGSLISQYTLDSLVKHIPSDTSHITITGGEPFLFGIEIFSLFEQLKAKFTNTEFLLLTNGRIFSSSDYCLKLKSTLPHNTIIGIPIHGNNAKLHDMITQTTNSFSQTVSGIKNLLRLGMNVEIRIVVSKLNCHAISDICSFIVRELKRACRIKIIGLEMLGNAAINKDQVWIPYKEAFINAKEGIKNLVLHGLDVGLYNFPLCSVDKEYWSIYEKSISDYKVRYAEVCNNCIMKDKCGGIFAGTMKLAANDVVPILGDNNA